MSNEKKMYTIFWSVENYSYCWHKNAQALISPDFSIKHLENTNWTLRLYPRGIEDEDKGYVSIFFRRNADTASESISLSYEISIIGVDGTAFPCREHKFSFKKGEGRGWGKFLKIEEMLLRKKAHYLPQDTLKIRCKVWEGEGTETNIGQISARTRIKVEKVSFLHLVENFSKLQPNVKRTIKIESHKNKDHSISSSLYFTEGLCCEKRIMVEVLPSDADQILRKCEFYLLDKSGKLIECGKTDNLHDTERENIHSFPLSLAKNAILNKKSEYLPNDKLSVLCELTFSAGIEFQSIEEIRHEMFLDSINRIENQTSDRNEGSSSVKFSEYPGALEDIKALYISESLTDVVLKTKEKSFPTHKVILSARSPVFKAMMTSNMKEKNTDIIQVDDLESSIVQQMLLFLYSDSIPDLQWSTALKLYYAADKYEIGKLKNICSLFLVANLTSTNASELLLLADTHNDSHLKKTVEDFILDHEQQVFGSKEWEKLMETNPLLVMKSMHLKYKRNCEAK